MTDTTGLIKHLDPQNPRLPGTHPGLAGEGDERSGKWPEVIRCEKVIGGGSEGGGSGVSDPTETIEGDLPLIDCDYGFAGTEKWWKCDKQIADRVVHILSGTMTGDVVKVSKGNDHFDAAADDHMGRIIKPIAGGSDYIGDDYLGGEGLDHEVYQGHTCTFRGEKDFGV